MLNLLSVSVALVVLKKKFRLLHYRKHLLYNMTSSSDNASRFRNPCLVPP